MVLIKCCRSKVLLNSDFYELRKRGLSSDISTVEIIMLRISFEEKKKQSYWFIIDLYI